MPEVAKLNHYKKPLNPVNPRSFNKKLNYFPGNPTSLQAKRLSFRELRWARILSFMSSMFLHPLVWMLKFCIKSITSAMSSASSNFCLMVSVFLILKEIVEKLNTGRPVAKEFSIFGIILQGLHSQNHHVTTYGKQSFTSCLCLMQNAFWSSKVVLEPDNIDIWSENTNPWLILSIIKV